MPCLHRWIHVAALVVVVVGAGALAACDGPPLVGNACFTPTEPPPSVIAVASPSPDCVSHMCMAMEGTEPASGPAGLCTARCEVDDDCVEHEFSRCDGGFVCAVATEVGPYCCEKLCVCADDLSLLPRDQTGCDPSLAANACVNLPGR